MTDHIDVDRDGMRGIGSLANSLVADLAQASGRPFHAPGIYFGMDDTTYHADPALGSTGLKRLLSSAPDFWWQSPMNPAREPDKETEAKLFGRAVHKCVLEGREAFEEVYAVAPSPDEYPGCLRTIDDLRTFLEASGLPKTGKRKDELIERAKTVAGCPAIFDEVLGQFEAGGKIPLKRDDFNRILAASSLIKANERLANAFENGMPEVSIFWERDGMRFKARFDYLKLNAIADLKSIRNPLNKPFKRACRDRIAELDYTLSAEHYMDGRRQMARLLADGAVYGDHDPEWLRKVVANDVFAFVFVFWQAEGAPISHGFKMSPGNPLFAYARQRIAHAVYTYETFMREFGTDTAWVLSEPLDELDETEMPAWWQVAVNTGT